MANSRKKARIITLFYRDTGTHLVIGVRRKGVLRFEGLAHVVGVSLDALESGTGVGWLEGLKSPADVAVKVLEEHVLPPVLDATLMQRLTLQHSLVSCTLGGFRVHSMPRR